MWTLNVSLECEEARIVAAQGFPSLALPYA